MSMPPYPSEDDRTWLTEALAEILERIGYDGFLVGPIIEPTARFFPDRYAPGTAGVETVARRLLSYMGDEVPVEVQDVGPREDDRLVRTWDLLATHEAGRIVVEVHAFGEAEHLPAALSHYLAS